MPIYTPVGIPLRMPAGTVINGVKDFVAAAFEVLQNAQHEFVFLVPSSILSRAGTYGSVESAKRFIDNGGVVKGILPISFANIEETRVRLKIGEDLRFSDEVHELLCSSVTGGTASAR